MSIIFIHRKSNKHHNTICFSNYTVQRRHSQRTHIHPCEYTSCSFGLSATRHSTFLSKQIRHQQPAISCFLSKQINIGHQTPAKRTDWHARKPYPRSIFEDWAVKSSRLSKSPQTSRYLRECRIPLKAQMSLNHEKFALAGSQTRDMRCYRDSCNH
jgi:hypothetical protein